MLITLFKTKTCKIFSVKILKTSLALVTKHVPCNADMMYTFLLKYFTKFIMFLANWLTQHEQLFRLSIPLTMERKAAIIICTNVIINEPKTKVPMWNLKNKPIYFYTHL